MKEKRALLLFFCVCLAATGAAGAVANFTLASDTAKLVSSHPVPSTYYDQPRTKTVGAGAGAYDDGGTKKFDVITSTKLSWGDALIFCKERHTDLATIRSQEENDALVDLMTKSGLCQGMMSFWIGGTITTSPKGYFWMNDGQTVNIYPNWHKGEPNNSSGHDSCMTYLYYPSGYETKNLKWNDDSCANPYYFVCEYYS